MISIRRRLFLSLLSSFMICITIVMLYVFFQTRHELKEIFDNNMRESAELLRDTRVAETPSFPPSAPAIDINEQLVLQIWDKNGNLRYSVPQSEAIPLNRRLRDGAARTPGYLWQTHTIQTKDGGFIQVARSETMVTHLIEENALQALTPFLILFVLLGAGAWILIGRSLMPLNLLSGEIASRRTEQLDPIVMENIPAEVKPIIHALNGLLKKLADALDMQRRFTADAAHELRTPLTALRLQIDLLKKAQSESDRQDAIQYLEAGVDRSTRLVHQLLMASRVRGASHTRPAVLSLPDTLRSVATDFTALAKGRNITLRITCPDSVFLQADEERLRSLIGNLLDNAVRYTPDQGDVAVICSVTKENILLEVCDSGPGIPADQREKIFERFYRMPGTKETGSGLGLAIVRDIADQLGAEIRVTDGPKNQGTCFSIRFQKPEAVPGK